MNQFYFLIDSLDQRGNIQVFGKMLPSILALIEMQYIISSGSLELLSNKVLVLYMSRGVSFGKFNPLHVQDWAYLGQKSGQNTLTELTEHKIKAIFQLNAPASPLHRLLIWPYLWVLVFSIFCILELSAQLGDTLRLVYSRG